MGYRPFDYYDALVLLDGKPAGATLHESREREFRDCPVFDREKEKVNRYCFVLFDKRMDPDGQPHELRLRIKWMGRKPSSEVRETGDGMRWVRYQRGSDRIYLSAHLGEGYDVEDTADGLAYRIPAGCPLDRFFFGLSHLFSCGNRIPDKPCFFPNPARVIPEEVDRYHFRLIGGNRRFGNGYRTLENGRRQYFAFYGFPDRNDDYFYNAEISREEFYAIEKEYDCCSSTLLSPPDYYDRYIKDHPILLEGWSRIL